MSNNIVLKKQHKKVNGISGDGSGNTQAMQAQSARSLLTSVPDAALANNAAQLDTLALASTYAAVGQRDFANLLLSSDPYFEMARARWADVMARPLDDPEKQKFIQSNFTGSAGIFKLRDIIQNQAQAAELLSYGMNVNASPQFEAQVAAAVERQLRDRVGGLGGRNPGLRRNRDD